MWHANPKQKSPGTEILFLQHHDNWVKVGGKKSHSTSILSPGNQCDHFFLEPYELIFRGQATQKVFCLWPGRLCTHISPFQIRDDIADAVHSEFRCHQMTCLWGAHTGSGVLRCVSKVLTSSFRDTVAFLALKRSQRPSPFSKKLDIPLRRGGEKLRKEVKLKIRSNSKWAWRAVKGPLHSHSSASPPGLTPHSHPHCSIPTPVFLKVYPANYLDPNPLGSFF